ncbi:hypothetical protein [Sphingobium fluviale]|uniref:Flagellar basal body-associated FliL family protein n=1 Tax=Sphingobium fluviale TaxID=2506423 RepID=A0A4Q1KGE1_9SPHN|nr:hypothetical protein [Sphingobium fluviale]RXR28375.1 hypothetical protein EQG66_09995 [Sphingobium fluviale]
MKKLLTLILLLALGLGLGGGAAYGVAQLLGPPPPKAAPPKAETVFISAGTLLAPIVATDGRLSGYANFEVQLEVSADKQAEVTEKIPLLLHAINLRTWATPMAAGPDHILPDLRVFAAVVNGAAIESLGKNMVHRVIITSAKPT